jgi:hypothetical protein
MTRISTAFCLVRSSLGASLLGSALLICSAQVGRAASITLPSISAEAAAQDASEAPSGAMNDPARPAQFRAPPVAIVGFGWG